MTQRIIATMDYILLICECMRLFLVVLDSIVLHLIVPLSFSFFSSSPFNFQFTCELNLCFTSMRIHCTVLSNLLCMYELFSDNPYLCTNSFLTNVFTAINREGSIEVFSFSWLNEVQRLRLILPALPLKSSTRPLILQIFSPISLNGGPLTSV